MVSSGQVMTSTSHRPPSQLPPFNLICSLYHRPPSKLPQYNRPDFQPHLFLVTLMVLKTHHPHCAIAANVESSRNPKTLYEREHTSGLSDSTDQYVVRS